MKSVMVIQKEKIKTDPLQETPGEQSNTLNQKAHFWVAQKISKISKLSHFSFMNSKYLIVSYWKKIYMEKHWIQPLDNKINGAD